MGPEIPVDRQGRHADRRDDGRHAVRASRKPWQTSRSPRSARRCTSVSSGRCARARSRRAASCRTRARSRTSRRPRRSIAPCREPSVTRWTTSSNKVHEAGPHAEGRLRHRLRILDAAPARRLRRRAPARTPPARCRSWISTTRCASPCRRPAAAAARRWAPSTSAIRTRSDFIRAKRENGRLQAVQPVAARDRRVHRGGARRPRVEARLPAVACANTTRRSTTCTIRSPSSGASGRTREGYVSNEEGLVACKIYKTLPAQRLWDVIMALDLRLSPSPASS